MSEQLQDYDTGDKESVNNARKKASRIRASRLRFVAAAMENKEGRAWFYDFLVFCDIYGNPFMEEETHKTAFKLGQQNVGKMVLGYIMDAAPDEYLTMLSENKELEEGKTDD